MKVYEFGEDRQRIFVLLPCTAEPWWAFEASARELGKDYHVYLFIPDGHDEQGTTFTSIEETVRQVGEKLRERGIVRVSVIYGVSMGGAMALRFLATEGIPVERAIIDGGITPYAYPRPVCFLIAVKDWVTMMLGSRSFLLMKLAMPPKRWTPEGEDPEEHYRRIFDFEKNHFSSRTIWNVFWSTNNYAMPDPVPEVDTRIEYWYGQEEKGARRADIAYTCRVYPKTLVREFPGLAHAELVQMYPKRLAQEIAGTRAKE